MRHAGFEDWIDRALFLKPFQKGFHLPVHLFCRWRLIVNLLASDRTGDDLHGSMRVIAPGTSPDLGEATLSGRKQSCMPTEQAVSGQRFAVTLRGVEHHID